MHKIPTTVIAAATVLLAPGATAGTPDWNYIEGSYIDTDIDSGGSLDGWELEGSWNFYDDWAYLRASYSDQDEDLDSLLNDFELDILSIGVGGIWWLADTTALYGEVSYEDWSLELQLFSSPDINEDDSGYRAAAGIRSVVWQGLELNAEAGMVDVGEIVDSEGFYRLGAIYTFGKGIGVGASYEEIDDLETWRISGDSLLNSKPIELAKWWPALTGRTRQSSRF